MSAPGKTEPTDLIVRARTGDANAWGELYREYAPAIFRFCRRAMPTREDAEDATMEIFMKLREKLTQYDQSRSFTAWLYKVSANHCWDMLRRRRVRQDKETDDVENVPPCVPEAVMPVVGATSSTGGFTVRVAVRVWVPWPVPHAFGTITLAGHALDAVADIGAGVGTHVALYRPFVVVDEQP